MLPEILQQHLVLPQVGLHARVIHNPSQRASKYQTIKTRQHSLNLFSELFDKLVHGVSSPAGDLSSNTTNIIREQKTPSPYVCGYAALCIPPVKHAQGTLERAGKRGLQRRQADPVRHLGVDEKAFRKGHKYMTVVNDLTRGRVLYVAEDRKQQSLDGFWGTLTDAQRQAIEAVAMDMWDPYVTSVQEHVADADKKIVFDKFHIAQHLSQAVDQVRRK